MSTDEQQQQQLPTSSLAHQKKKYANGPTTGRCEEWYLDSSTADVHFTFGSADSSASSSSLSARVAAHKYPLATNSDVFKVMFYGALKESGDINIIDVSEAAFKEFLQFFYLNEVEMNIETVADLMYLCHKYMVTNCIDVCIKFLTDCHTAENILFILSLAIFYDHPELIKSCERFIVLNTNAILESSDFLECDRQTLAHILDMNVLSCSEVDVFEACMAWVRAKSEQNNVSKAVVQKYLGDLYYKIRFASMSFEEFCTLEAKYESVLSQNFIEIGFVITFPENIRTKFNKDKRVQIKKQ